MYKVLLGDEAVMRYAAAPVAVALLHGLRVAHSTWANIKRLLTGFCLLRFVLHVT
jgi:hypothetical protein